MTPDVSVVIPAFNAEATLGEQLAALAAQDTRLRFEVLVCDNGSSDGTSGLVRRAQRDWPWLRLVDASARRGASAARNIGAAAAKAPLVLFCDADDVVSTRWVGALAGALASAPFAAGAVEHALLNPGRDWDFGWDRPLFSDPALPQLLAGGSGNMGIRADVFAEVGGFEEGLHAAEDIDFSWRVQLAGHALVGVPEAVVHVRKRSGLRAAMRQAYAKGAGGRMLAYRYALVRAAYERESGPAEGREGGDGGPGRLARLRRLPAKVAGILRSPSQVIPYATALAHATGYRRAATAGIPQVAPPAHLPSSA